MEASAVNRLRDPCRFRTRYTLGYKGELYNGFGPRAHGRRTGYLWGWTNIYTGGKYVADGKWDPDTKDQQCGMVPMMAALLRLDATLALVDVLPAPALPSPASGGDGGLHVPLPASVPVGVGGGPARRQRYHMAPGVT